MKTLLISLVLAVGGPWSLSDCIQYALEHNISIQQSANSVQQKEIELNTARGRRLPGVSAGVSQNFSFGRGLTQNNTYSNANTTSTSISLGADMPLFQGFDIKYDIAMSEIDLEASTAELEKARDDIRVAVAAAYMQILYDKEILQVARRQVSLDSLLLVRVTGMRASGKSSAADVAAQEATYAQSRLTEVRSENNLKLSVLELSQLLELPSPDGFDVVAPAVENLGVRLLEKPEYIYECAVGVKPQIKAELLRLDYADANISRAKGGYLPSLSLSGGIGTNYYTNSLSDSDSFSDQIDKNFSQYVGLSLSIPIFSRFSTRNSVKSAELSKANQQLELEKTKKSLYKEIQQAYYNAEGTAARYLSGERAVESARASLDLEKQRYENGKSTVAEWNQAETRWLEAESEFLQARYEYLYQTRILDFYMGKELAF